jgi:hypothetical protein
MYIAVCQKKCTFRGQLWPVGRKYKGVDEPPKHFKILSSPDAELLPPDADIGWINLDEDAPGAEEITPSVPVPAKKTKKIEKIEKIEKTEKGE